MPQNIHTPLNPLILLKINMISRHFSLDAPPSSVPCAADKRSRPILFRLFVLLSNNNGHFVRRV